MTGRGRRDERGAAAGGVLYARQADDVRAARILARLIYGVVVIGCRISFARIPDRLPALRVGAEALALCAAGLVVLAREGFRLRQETAKHVQYKEARRQTRISWKSCSSRTRSPVGHMYSSRASTTIASLPGTSPMRHPKQSES